MSEVRSGGWRKMRREVERRKRKRTEGKRKGKKRVTSEHFCVGMGWEEMQYISNWLILQTALVGGNHIMLLLGAGGLQEIEEERQHCYHDSLRRREWLRGHFKLSSLAAGCSWYWMFVPERNAAAPLPRFKCFIIPQRRNTCVTCLSHAFQNALLSHFNANKSSKM